MTYNVNYAQLDVFRHR